ncbi:MAG: MucB/RseB C-terminal domain-containing protein [Gammaproteobacteria bacterium]
MAAAALAGAALVYAASTAAEGPEYWLSRLAHAAQSVSFHGEVTHRHGDRVQSLELARRVGPDGYAERILTLSGSPREVVRDGKTITCVLPAGRERLDGRLPRNPFPTGWADPDQLAANYELLDLGADRVAGRACRVIGVRPRDAFRYGFRLWVDAETGLLLRSDAVDERGEVVEQVTFTRVSIPAELDPRRVATSLSGTTVRWKVVGDDAGHIDDLPWMVGALPPGFAADGIRVREHATTQRVFTDGLAKVSVFVAPVDSARKGLAGTSRMGAVSAFGTVIEGHQVTVVGEVPLATVRLIGESLAFGRR